MGEKNAVVPVDRADLVCLEVACQRLEEARQTKDFSLAKLVRDQAQTCIDYVRLRREFGLKAMQDAAEVKIRAERTLGEMLAEIPRSKAGRPGKNSIHRESNFQAVLRANGFNPGVAIRWQQIARVPQKAFHDYAAEVRKAGEELTTAGVLRLVPPRPKKVRQKEPPSPVSGGDLWTVDRADCLAWFAAQDADSIDLVFGSPPYEQARLYLEDGENLGIARDTDAWVAWMVDVYKAALRCCRGLVAFVVEGQTKDYRWSGAPALLMAALVREGICLRKPPVYQRVGIPGSGGPDWLRNDYEFIVCATRGGPLPWSDNTAMGHEPKYGPGGDPSHRTQDGRRVNQVATERDADMKDRANVGPHRARRKARREAGKGYTPPERSNPGNVVACGAVGGGNMGSDLCHENEAPFPESLAEFFVRSFCSPGRIVCDPFSGSGTTGAVSLRWGRRFRGCDVRQSQVELTRRRFCEAASLFDGQV